MKNRTALLVGAAGFALAARSLQAQTEIPVPTPVKLQAGVSYLILDNDYTNNYNKGLSIFADYAFNRFLAVEGKAQFGGIIAARDVGENSYAVGPKFLWRYQRAALYGKFLSGVSTISNQNLSTTQRYSVYAFGGGLEFKVSKRINLRPIDFEIQKWRGFNPHTLTPVATSFGVSYILK